MSKGEEDDGGSIGKLLEMYQRLEERCEKMGEMMRYVQGYICSHCKGRFEGH